MKTNFDDAPIDSHEPTSLELRVLLYVASRFEQDRLKAFI
jgi:hypothetical protein